LAPSKVKVTRLARGEVFVSYCHPYEFDPDEFSHLSYPLPLKTWLHQGVGRGGFEAKFRKMIDGFETCHADCLVKEKNWPKFVMPGKSDKGEMK